MATPDYGVKIAEDFQNYLKTGNRGIVERYTAKELKTAIGRLSPWYDNNKLWYREMEQRIRELESDAELRKKQSIKSRRGWDHPWAERIIAYVLGILSGLVLSII